MFKSSRKLIKDIASRSDRSNIFKETLLDAAINNEFGFKEEDILPLFAKYQSKRQIIIDILSFSTYVVQLPTQFHLRRSRNSNFVPRNRDRWFKANSVASSIASLVNNYTIL